jgi:8-hydroxy-5-deazaflavin:NADPH oxidoreductase
MRPIVEAEVESYNVLWTYVWFSPRGMRLVHRMAANERFRGREVMMNGHGAYANHSESMRIGVIGAGWMGGSVGRAWLRAGHEVMFSSRHPDQLRATFGDLGSRALIGSTAEAAEFAQVVLLTLPYAAIPALAHELGPILAGKVVVDAANPSADPRSTFAVDTYLQGVGVTTQQLLPNAVVVRAFSCVDATAVDASSHERGERLAVPIAGDNADAVKLVERLVRDAGCDPLIVGGLLSAKQFERGTGAFRANATLPRLNELLLNK